MVLAAARDRPHGVEKAFQLNFAPRPPDTGDQRTNIDAMSFQGQESYTRRRFDFFLPRGVAGQEGGIKPERFYKTLNIQWGLGHKKPSQETQP